MSEPRKDGEERSPPELEARSPLDKILLFCLNNKLVVALLVAAIALWGLSSAPFDWDLGGLPRSPVAVDAIPDLGENQQIVFTKWPGRSPQDIEDQISYPLTVSMLGIPGVKTVRSSSMFGFSSIYVIFKEDVGFYWSRSRIIEKLNSLPSGSLPEGVQPSLGPDATALGQVYWYTLEGRDEQGRPTGGWDLHELRTIQDWYVRYGLLAAEGISEVASVGGFVQEYQIDVNPDALRAHDVTLQNVFRAVKRSNIDVGARTVELSKAEYVIRGLGFIKNVHDIERSVVKVNDNVPIYIENVATVSLGPALRRGALDKNGAEVVGGVAVVRYGYNPLAAIKNLKRKIKELEPGLPAKIVVDYDKVGTKEVETFAAEKGFEAYEGKRLNQQPWLEWHHATPPADRPDWLTSSQVNIVPFYDRTGLIYETLGTLNTALTEEILVTIIVILIMLMHLRSSMVISLTLPLAVLLCFIAMKLFGVDANIVALSGIAIAIGTIVDMGVILCENILRHLEDASADKSRLSIVYEASQEVAGAVVTAVLTTIVSFLPVFTMIGAEGKLFKPLAFTKTFALLASVIVALTIVPSLAHVLFTFKFNSERIRKLVLALLALLGAILCLTSFRLAGILILIVAGYHLFQHRVPRLVHATIHKLVNVIVVAFVSVILVNHWLPLGPGAGFWANFLVVAIPIASLLAFFWVFMISYPHILALCLKWKSLFLPLPVAIVVFGASAWLGFDTLFGWLPDGVRKTETYAWLNHEFPGLGKEFMPNLDEGSFLFMPTTMPHASIGEAMDVLRKQDIAIEAIPEVVSAVGKIGRAETPLDPAPISMIETIINYHPQYLLDQNGNRRLFKYDPDQTDYFRDESAEPLNSIDGEPYLVQGKYLRNRSEELVPDDDGMPFRLWRPAVDPNLNPGRKPWSGIRDPDDIWKRILKAAEIPGTTSAPKLQPIAARIVMLQSGMRAPMGVKIKGPDLKTIETVGLDIEQLLKEVPGVEPAAVFADRIVGKPYLEIDIDRDAIARYGIQIQDVQDVIESAIGGRRVTTTIEGRERYPVRVRYQRELRDSVEALMNILVASPAGEQIPISQLAAIKYSPGPQVIKSEDTFLVGYVLFDKKDGFAEVDVVENAKKFLESKIASGELIIPAGVSYAFAGNYKNQIRAQRTLSIVLPLALFVIFMILYFQFKSVPISVLVFSGIAVAWSGGFILLWFYGQEWFMNFTVFGMNMRTLFQMHEINLSVAVWVGFLALFGIATDNGVVITTYLNQSFEKAEIDSIKKIRETTVLGANRRIRPCLITTATTILALLPILTSTGRGSDIMVPMAIPSFGGMLVVLVSAFLVPVLYCALKELKFKLQNVDL